MLLHSRYSMEFIYRASIKLLAQLLTKAFEKSEIDRAWDMWISLLPHMNRDNFIPFSKFIESHEKPTAESNMDKEEIIKRAELIKERFK